MSEERGMTHDELAEKIRLVVEGRHQNLSIATIAINVELTQSATGQILNSLLSNKIVKRKTAKKKRTRRKVSRKKKRVSHRSPRHKGHKRVSFTTASGQKVNFLVKKKVRKHKHRRHHK